MVFWGGYLAILGGVALFGSFGLPVRLKRVKAAKVDPMICQFYYSLSIFISSWLVLTYNEFKFSYYGVASAAIWVPACLLMLASMQFVGLAIAQGTWCGSTIIVSFLWGVLYFHDHLDLQIAGGALGLVIIGTAILSIANTSFVNAAWSRVFPRLQQFHGYPIKPKPPVDSVRVMQPTMEGYTRVPVHDGESPTDSFNSTEAINSEREVETQQPPPAIETQSLRKSIIGVVLALLCGIPNGSMLVPLRLGPKSEQSIEFMVSFGIGVMGVTPLIMLAYYILRRKLPKFEFRIAMIPCMIGGLIWNLGLYCVIYSVLYFGLAIGFPITRTALLVAGIWDLLWFRQFNSWGCVIVFFVGASILVSGAILLILSGTVF